MTFDYLYLLAAVLFILGIKDLTRIRNAKRGNLLASLGMLLAVLVTLAEMHLKGQIGWAYILGGILLGGAIGLWTARKVQMTAMPELVAVFNGFGGGASVLVALAYYLQSGALPRVDLSTIVASVIIGAVTLTGSVIAFAKLKGILKARPIVFPGNNLINLFVAILALGVGVIVVIASGHPLETALLLASVFLALILGVLLVIPIGGADMPVVISLLNSYSGIAAAATGFALKNSLLVIAGALVGASGIILTKIMCRAMNRSLANVLFGGFGQEVVSAKSSGYTSIKETSPEEVALMLDGAEKVIIVPGYGMAVGQAQFAAQELSELLMKKGVKVGFAIHPVAGRMPGHMNVLLAEANVPYELLKEMDDINPEFKSADVVIVIGANDVVNPAAATDKGSPIYGMPILKAHEARTIVVIKRSLSPGFAGIDNRLFENDNTLMLFMDAKEGMQKIVQEVEEI